MTAAAVSLMAAGGVREPMSCDAIAVDVALLLSPELVAAATSLNAQLSPMFRFDETHLPHLTIVQQFIEKASILDVQRIIEAVGEKLEPIQISVQDIDVQKFENTRVLYWVVEPTVQLTTLHNQVSSMLQALACEGDGRSFVRDEGQVIRDSTVAYVAHFYSASGGPRFNPHVTLGFGDVRPPQEPLSSTSRHIAVCQLGDLNTCRRVLYQYRF